MIALMLSTLALAPIKAYMKKCILYKLNILILPSRIDSVEEAHSLPCL